MTCQTSLTDQRQWQVDAGAIVPLRTRRAGPIVLEPSRGYKKHAGHLFGLVAAQEEDMSSTKRIERRGVSLHLRRSSLAWAVTTYEIAEASSFTNANAVGSGSGCAAGRPAGAGPPTTATCSGLRPSGCGAWHWHATATPLSTITTGAIHPLQDHICKTLRARGGFG